MRDENGEPDVKNFEFAISLLERRIEIIMEATESTEPPVFYMTADAFTMRELNKINGTNFSVIPNFRDRIAISKPYKGNRAGAKPYHFKNITAHILHNYQIKVANGIEADDLLAIDHTQDPKHTIICSRDKDLRMIPGRHYGWPMGKLLSFGPKTIDSVGYLDEPKKGKLTGGGFKFFCAQMMMGDTVDNIPGLPGSGPVAAYKLFNDLNSEEELLAALKGAYENYFSDKDTTNWLDYFLEQASLLWIVRELDSEGRPVMFSLENNK